MANARCVASAKKTGNRFAVTWLALLTGLLLISTGSQAAVDKITTFKDAQGWKLLKNGEDFYVKGVVWSYSPRGQNYTYNLWDESDEFIMKVLDHDFGYMAKAGVTANRSFTMIPPRWVTYIYEKHGVMSLINPLMGRYGASIDGVWRPFTNYSDPLTRETLKAESLAIVEQYKDVKGVFMFAFGNESNYGLSWSSFEIEDLPVGEQNREKAKYLYSLWGEVVSEGKQLAPDHLFTIVNGDIQYLDLIAEYVQDMDVLGTNVYRGISFGNLWKDVSEGFDRPIIFMEFGSDAFNSKNYAEDQPAQASFLRGQWQEMYNESYGNGGYGNAVGGFVFEFRDEWWKYKQTENLDVQDRNASWANGGYTFDFVEGQNNMNEEWFGIMRLGNMDKDGVFVAEPRMAYDVLTEMWSIDPSSRSKPVVNATVNDIDMDLLELKSDIRDLKESRKQDAKFRYAGGSFQGDFLAYAYDSDVDQNGEEGLQWGDDQMLFLDFEFQPTERISGAFSLNILGNRAESQFEQRYGDRGLPYTVEAIETTQVSVNSTGTFAVEDVETEITDNNRIEIYDFQATYEDNNYDFELFYHTPRYHWGYEGDFYGLLRETTDMAGQDIWNAKAPYGVEYAGKQELSGLKVVAGPEVYWGANPKIMLKYQFGRNKQYAFLLSEDIARADTSAAATEATEEQSRQATLYSEFAFGNGSSLQLGGIMSATERIGDEYDRVEGDDVVEDEIEFVDTLGLRARYNFNAGASRAYVGFNYGGLVADGGDYLTEFGTSLPYSGLGNKVVIEGGLQITHGDYMWYPRLFWRENLVDANPLIDPVSTGTTLEPGVSPRNQDDDPFAVLDNRDAKSAELIFTFDPTPSTWFYHWNVDLLEDAPFAYNVGLIYTDYSTDTDSYEFFFEEGGTNAAFGEGLEATNVWAAKTKMIFNPRKGLKAVFNAELGKKQSGGQPGEEPIEYFSFNTKMIFDKEQIYQATVRIDDFGPYDFQEQFNVVYPLQVELEYTFLLDPLKDELNSSQVGVKLFYQTLDDLSPANQWQDGENDWMAEIQTYYKIAF